MENMPLMETKEEKFTAPAVLNFNDLAVRIKENGIVTDDEALFAESQLVHIKRLQKEIEDHHAESIGKAHDTHKTMIAARDKVLKPVKDAEKIIKKAVGDYSLEEHAKGVSVKSKFKAKIINLDSIPDQFIEPKANIKAIEAILNAGGTIEGVEAVETKTVTVRS